MAKSKRTKPKKPPRPVIVIVDSDNDYWLRTGKRARRLLTRAEFLDLAARGGVIVTRQ